MRKSFLPTVGILLIVCLFSSFSATAQENGDEAGDGIAIPLEDTLLDDPREPASIWSVAWRPDGNQIASGAGPTECGNPTNDYSVQIMDALTGTIVNRLGSITNECPIDNLDWSPDGMKLVGSGLGQAANVWNVSSGISLAAFNALTPPGFIDSLWSPDGTRIASIQGANTQVRIWNPQTGETFLTFEADSPSSIAWSPDGSKLATTRDDIRIWDATTGDLLNTFATGPIGLIVWSPNGTRIAGIDGNLNVIILDSSTGSVILTLSGHTDYITQVVWQPNGQALASASYDGTVRVWDSATGTQLDVLQYSGEVYALTWSPDGSRIVFGGARSDGQDAQLEIRAPNIMSLPTATSTPVPSDPQ